MDGSVSPATSRPAQRARSRLDQPGPVDLNVAFRCELGDDQVALFGGDKQLVSLGVLDDERGCPAFLGRQLSALPEPLACPSVEPAKLTVAPNPIEIVSDDERRGDDRVQPVGLVGQL